MGFPSSNATQSDPGVAVNVNGSYGFITADPETNQYVVDVNTTGKPVYGQPIGGTGTVGSVALAGLPGWAPMAIVIGLFLLAVAALGSKK